MCLDSQLPAGDTVSLVNSQLEAQFLNCFLVAGQGS